MIVTATAAKRYLISLAAIVIGVIMRKYIYEFEDDSAILQKGKYISEGYDINTRHSIDESFLKERLQNSLSADEDHHDHYYYAQDDDDIIFDIDTGEFIGDDDYVRENLDRQMELKLRGNWI
ncbi:predicted protein [Chaetoceros tenuissimus]|uniref:Uncharacterized protein n=1 Tax=Chaetoceros tenuissimus TaxID=426638 RepID=A0AAD3DBT6_9STRA|nr:predicted protein [Chaetoceros tenuissimus]